MDEAAKIYSVKIRWSERIPDDTALVTVGLEEDGMSPNFEKNFDSPPTKESVFICEPPLPARYVKIEKKGEVLQLCEVDVHATGNPCKNVYLDIEILQNPIILTHKYTSRFFSSCRCRTRSEKQKIFPDMPYRSLNSLYIADMKCKIWA